MGIQKISEAMDAFMSWISLLFGLVVMFFAFLPFLGYKKMINFLNNNGIYHEAIANFPSAQSFMDDRMRFGNKYIFCRRQCVILRYYDICKVCQVTYEGEGSEHGRKLCAVDISGKRWYLCALNPNTDNQPGLNEAIDFMLSKNSRIEVDYRT